ncbi:MULTISPECIES: flavin monoamine oxidase family protein [Amycolatopsis]|uniref:Flavin monoamine oxidase family protein n=1 Tax=Amycolatopsis albidoflavus TaxID=102226 RepID=A0ABW5I991_9PSEU
MTPSPALETTVAIVGAGMAGLVAARDLRRAGIDVVVLESAGRVGGRVLSETSALGSRLDLGGQWIGHGHHRFETLAKELGGTVFPMHTPKRPVVVDDAKPVPRSTMAAANLALAVWELRAKLGAPAKWEHTTVGQWIAKSPGRRSRRVLEALVAASSCADLDLLTMHAFASMIRHQGGLATMMATKGGAQDSLLTEGAGTLAERLAAELGTRVRTDCRVTAVRSAAEEVTVETLSGVVSAKKAIITAPPPTAARIAFHPPLPAARTRLAKNMYLGAVYKAIAVYDRPFWRERNEAELVVLDKPASVTFDTSPPGGPGHLCVLIGGSPARELDALAPDERRDLVLGPLAARLGPEVRSPASFHEKAWHLDDHAGGGYSALPKPGSRDGYFPIPADPVGHVHWAGTETAAEHAGYIEGAIESGQRVAREVAAVLND